MNGNQLEVTGDLYLAKTLVAYQVTHFFHAPLIVPGAMRLMEQSEFPIQAVSVHNEKAAAYMADGYARVTGKPGICGCQGIGRSNLLAGLRDAFMGNSPIIALTAGVSDADSYRGSYQDVDDLSAFNSVTKFNGRVNQLDRLPDMLRQAFRAATSGCPSPTHLEISGMLGNLTWGKLFDDNLAETRFSSVPSFRPAADKKDISAVFEVLAKAERPVIIAGGGVVASGGQQALREFARLYQIPVATSLNAKGAILENDPLSVGVVGIYSRESANRVVHEADLVFYIGSSTGGLVTTQWSIPAMGTPVVQLDIEPCNLGRNYPNAASLCGDVKAILEQLIDASPSAPITHSRATWEARVETIKQEWVDKYAEIRRSPAIPLRPERVITDLASYLPENAIVVCDTGHAGMWCAQFLEITSPNQKFIRAAGSLGWAFPAALGAKCGHPDRPVFAFIGDGGFYYHLSELETARRYGINTITIVNNNYSLNQEAPVWDSDEYDHHWKFGKVSFTSVAKQFGCFGVEVRDPSHFKDALDEAIASNLPAVIELIADEKAMAPTRWLPEDDGRYLLDVARGE